MNGYYTFKMKSEHAALTSSLLLALLLLSLGSFQLAIEVKKTMEWDFENEITFFLLEDNSLAVWNSVDMDLSIFKDKEVIKHLKVTKGQGPQDFSVMSNILSTPNHYLIWDHMLRRFSFYSKEWKFEKIKKMSTLRFYHPLAIINDSHYLAMWNNFEKHQKGSSIYQNIGIVDDNKKTVIIHKTGGAFNDSGTLNLDRPHLITSLSEKKLFVADNNRYKVFMTPIKANEIRLTEKIKYIERDVSPIKWNDQCTNLQWEISKKPQTPPKIKYPDNIPPLFSIASSGDMVAVVTNERILQNQSKIDFFKGQQYVGSIEIPLLYAQYFIFPSWLYFKPGIILKGNDLFTLHYFDDEDVFQIIKWKVNLI